MTTRTGIFWLGLTLAGALSASAQPADEGLPLPPRRITAPNAAGHQGVRAGRGHDPESPAIDRYTEEMMLRFDAQSVGYGPARETWTPDGGLTGSVNGERPGASAPVVLNGFDLELDGVRIRHLTAASPADALAFASNSDQGLSDGSGPQVVEVRGQEVRILTGARLEDPAFAAKVRAATWELLPAKGPSQLLSVSRDSDRFAAELAVPHGELYGSIQNALDKAQRRRADLAKPDSSVRATWRSESALRVHLPGDLASEIRVDPDGGLSALAPEGEIDELLAYLQAVRGEQAGAAARAGGAQGRGLGSVVEEIERELGR